MPQLDVTVFFFELLWLFIFLVFFVPWVGTGVLGPIAESVFLRWSLNLLNTFLVVVFAFNFGGRTAAATLRSFAIFCGSLLSFSSPVSWVSSKRFFFMQPAGLVSFAGWLSVIMLVGSGKNCHEDNPILDQISNVSTPPEKTVRCFDCYAEASRYVLPKIPTPYVLDFWFSGWSLFLETNVYNFLFLWSPFAFLDAIILESCVSAQEILGYVFLLIGVLLSVAFLTLAERKIMASSQRRMGPNLVGFWGILQPVADGLKLILKDADMPSRATKGLFFVAALLPFVTAFTSWIILPLSPSPLSDFSSGLLWVAAISSLGVYGIIFSGWASNSKYAFLGGLRSAAQVISYELVLSLVYLTVTIWNQSLNLYTIVEAQQRVCWNLFALFPCAVAFLIAMLAETNRMPFDLPEAESELVAGYNVEYRGVLFSLFFLAEYANMILMSALFVILFLGGWAPLSISGFGFGSFTFIPGSIFFILKIEILLAFFILARAALPRVRYDQLMTLGWKYMIPFLFGGFFFMSSLVFFVILS